MKQCPICYGKLEVRDCTPCHDCGGFDHEIEHLKQGLHTYSIYNIYGDLKLTLCNFCQVDFGSYKSEYLGFKNGKRLDLSDFEIVADIQNPDIEKDKFCTECGHRLKFLTFLTALRTKIDTTYNS